MGRGGPVVQVEGAARLRRTLKAAGDDMAELKDTHARVAGYVSARAATLAPKLTGRLAGSVRGNRAASSAVVRAGGASLPYAGVIHYGWPRHNIAADPFMTTAAHDTEATWIGFYTDELDRILSQVKGA